MVQIHMVCIRTFLLSVLIVTMVSSKVYFLEEFYPGWEKHCEKSKFKKEQQGQFEWTKGKWPLQTDMAYGLLTKTDLRFYDISCRLPTPITTGKAPFVLQYSLKFEKKPECGGGYIKLIGTDYKAEEFGGDSPVFVMFGPDICGNTNKIHLMLDFENGSRFWDKTPVAPTDDLTHIYTAVLYPNETYEVYLDMKLISSGTISEDWEASNPKMIPDPNDVKPNDWDDRMYINDPSSSKPTDWVDEEIIEDDSVNEPEDWDEEKDGVWKPPMKKNPKYKGEWNPPKVYNLNYRGIWHSRKIPNPNYINLTIKPYRIGGVGIDVWQVKHGSMFDNIMLTDSLDDAFAHAKKIIEIQVAEEKQFKAKELKFRNQKEKEDL